LTVDFCEHCGAKDWTPPPKLSAKSGEPVAEVARGIMVLITLVGMIFGIVWAYHRVFPPPWYLAEYQNEHGHDKAVLEYKNHTLFVECTGTTYKGGSEVPTCGWLRQHVGQHMDEGGELAQITRLGSSVCYHDGLGGEECYTVQKETAH
jgi:hypothetical protein